MNVGIVELARKVAELSCPDRWLLSRIASTLTPRLRASINALAMGAGLFKSSLVNFVLRGNRGTFALIFLGHLCYAQSRSKGLMGLHCAMSIQ